MPKKQNKDTYCKNQQTISKFFVSKLDNSTRKRTSDYSDCLKNLSPPTKITKGHHTQTESNSSAKCCINNSTIAKIHSYSVKSSLQTRGETDSILRGKQYSPEKLTVSCPENSLPAETKTSENKERFKTESFKSIKYTPLEKQYLEFKNNYPDAILLIECGYKFKFFGEDAEIASKILNIACFMSHNFMSAIIPVQRMHYHVRRLVLKGYKVGVVKQTETAALKAAGDKKNELFTRELDSLYTKATLIGEEFQTLDCDDENYVENDEGSSGYLVCVSETPLKERKGYSIAIVGVQLSSGDSVYSSFDDDSVLRNRLESCLHHLNPVEILIPSYLSKESKSLINGYSYERSVRLEKIDIATPEDSAALEKISRLLTQNSIQQKYNANSKDAMQKILTLPTSVLQCLSFLFDYLLNFKMEKVLSNIVNMKLLSTNESMILTAATLKGLELLKNNSNHTEHGSLLWVLNKTSTKFGERLLKTWILKPLKNLEKINERLDILAEIIHLETTVFKVIEKLLYKLPDLERVLCSVFYQKCSCFDFVKLTEALLKIHTELKAISDKIQLEVKSPRIKNLLFDIPFYLSGVEKYLSNINLEAAKNGEKTKIFSDLSMFPNLKKCKHTISNLERKLNDLRPEMSKKLKLIDLKYTTVAGQKYLVEVPNSNLSAVPKEWLKVSSTKQVSRFRSPEIIHLCKEIDQQNELMIKYANEAWSTFLDEFGNNFYKYKQAITYLAELDCYLSFAKVSKDEEFCRPQVVDSENRLFSIKQGRHPVVAKLIDEKQFVSNDISMNVNNNCVIVTGPNMGGKSTYVRQTALISLMAHIGCYVPAETATIPLFDNIYVRMGADDDIINRKSTFMVEMCEAAEVLNNATCKSFTVLDELGRGTSTNDGSAVAYAALEYLISDIKCFVLFVTHYPEILEIKDRFPDKVSTFTMAYILKDKNDDSDIETVTFLYNVINGVSEKSYGINVAALAGIPNNILSSSCNISQAKQLKAELRRRLKSLIMKIKALKK